ERPIRPRDGLPPGEECPVEIKVRGIDQPVTIAKAIVIAPPRPRITAVRKSFAGEAATALRSGEVPAGAPVSFELAVDRLDAAAAVDLACGEKSVRVPARMAGAGAMFFAVDPGAIGQSGCALTATVSIPATGASAPMALG